MLETDYFGSESDEKVYTDLRNNLGYAEKIKTPSRNDSKLNVTIELKAAFTKKMVLIVRGYANGVPLHDA